MIGMDAGSLVTSSALQGGVVDVLTLSRRYFFLRKPLERRLYELARKHCGQQREWRIGLEALREKCGSGSTPKEFKRLVGKIIEDDRQYDHMPDYAFDLDLDADGEVMTVHPKKGPTQPSLAPPFDTLRLRPETYEAARKATPRSDVYALEQKWRSWVADKGIQVKNPDAHFVSFCKSHAVR